jgi:hypothetical protein
VIPIEVNWLQALSTSVLICDGFSVNFANVGLSKRNHVSTEAVNNEFKSTALETVFSLWEPALTLQ